MKDTLYLCPHSFRLGPGSVRLKYLTVGVAEVTALANKSFADTAFTLKNSLQVALGIYLCIFGEEGLRLGTPTDTLTHPQMVGAVAS